MRRIIVLLSLLGSVPPGRAQDATPPSQTETARSPVPEAAAQKAAEKLVREIFKAEYGRRAPADQQALAVKLINEATAAKDDPTARYVMLKEAREISIQAGSAGTALQAIDLQGKYFEGETSALRLATLVALGKTAQSEEACRSLSSEGMRQSNWFAFLDDYVSAEKALAIGDAAARRGRDAGLSSRIQARLKEIQEIHREFVRVKGMIKTLEEKPDDAAANLGVGKFLCFVKGEWDQGLPMLAKGSESALKTVAQKDLESPQEAAGRVTAGDGWWDLHEKQSGGLRNACRERALQCYKHAWKGLEGAVRLRIRGRFRSAYARPVGAPAREAGRVPAQWGTPTQGKLNVGLDDSFAWSGRFSVRTEGTPDVSEIFSTMKPAVPGKQYRLTAVVMTDGTDGASSMGLLFWKSGGKEGADWPRVQMPADQPWWTPVEGVFTCPADKDEMQVGIDTRYAKGRTWIDDVSLKAVGSDVELVENGLFDK